MRPRPRTRRFLRWAGPSLVTIILVVGVASARWRIIAGLPIGPKVIGAGVGTGQTGLFFGDHPGPVAPGITREGPVPNVEWSFEWEFGPGAAYVIVPLWLPLMLALGVTIAAWRPARPRAGECPRCRYDRAGLAANSPCPECGHVSA